MAPWPPRVLAQVHPQTPVQEHLPIPDLWVSSEALLAPRPLDGHFGTVWSRLLRDVRVPSAKRRAARQCQPNLQLPQVLIGREERVRASASPPAIDEDYANDVLVRWH
ncbi:hypothetical protein Purlil1_1658 [Purpureocillium lilacinum]|uniref:Uncharacterized protein n=1 Tax=Purpureocillium lilacinum TaxID=33203 RepID=A0ABR0CDF4_PURLI|nr:hypothetical protein Purlil1_1658 [Purpureocillium lilacinum]